MANATNIVRLHRVLRASSERLYRGFLDPDAMAKWVPPHGFTGKVHDMEARVGGGYRMSFTNFGTGKSHSLGGRYTELTPYERIRYTDKFEDPNMPEEMQVTVTFRTVAVGTEIEIVQEGIPSAIPVEFCYLGWQESLALLAHLVEPNIPDRASPGVIGASADGSPSNLRLHRSAAALFVGRPQVGRGVRPTYSAA